MTWIVTGATGLLGPYLLEAIEPFYSVNAQRIELTNRDHIRDRILGINPSVFIHAAACTDVDWCQANKQAAEQINYIAVRDITDSLPASTKLVYISTDMIYSDTPGPHSERERDRPLVKNNYAISKMLGEAAAQFHHNTLILRTNFFGPSKNNSKKSFSDRILADECEVYYDDILFSPLHMRTLAELVVECVERNLIGVFNAGSRNGFSKHRFAEMVSGTVKPAGKSSFATPRPHDMRMDVSRLERVLGRNMPYLGDEIRKMLQ